MTACIGAGPYDDHCDGCNDSVAELRRIVDRLEAVHAAVRADLIAKGYDEPGLVTDATTGRYVLLDSLVAVLEARLALVRATT